jgi:hypothetical protein
MLVAVGAPLLCCLQAGQVGANRPKLLCTITECGRCEQCEPPPAAPLPSLALLASNDCL